MQLKKKIKNLIKNLPDSASLFLTWLILLKNAISNFLSHFKTNYKTQWVCTLEEGEIDQRAKYSHEVFTDYQNYGNLPKSLEGKVVLEVGPGENFGVALQCLSLGAAKVICVDRFHSLLPAAQQEQVYKKLATLNPSVESQLEHNGKIKPQESTLVYHSNIPLEQLDKILKENSVDVILSRAVLEHVYDPEECMKQMHRVLKPGGIMLHEIDFRDHGMFESYNLHPLTMLRIPKLAWKLATSNLGAPNRRLLPFFKTALSRLEYTTKTLIIHTHFSEQKTHNTELPHDEKTTESLKKVEDFKSKLTEPYRSYSSQDLLISAVFLSSIKA